MAAAALLGEGGDVEDVDLVAHDGIGVNDDGAPLGEKRRHRGLSGADSACQTEKDHSGTGRDQASGAASAEAPSAPSGWPYSL